MDKKRVKESSVTRPPMRLLSAPTTPSSFEGDAGDSFYLNAYGAKRLRRPNFKQEELETLVTLLEERPELASGKIGGVYCNAEAQRLAWQEVASLVSGVGEAERTGREIREKWIDFKSRVKQKYRKIKDVEEGMADDGLAIPLTPLEVRILNIVNAVSHMQPVATAEGLKMGYQEVTCNEPVSHEDRDTRSSNSPRRRKLKIRAKIVTGDVGGTTNSREYEIVPTSSKDSINSEDKSLVTITPVNVRRLLPRPSTTSTVSDRHEPAHQPINGYDTLSDTGSCTIIDADATTEAELDSGRTVTDRLLTQLSHKQDRLIDLLTELTEETYRRRTIEEETQGLLRTLVALQARRVELEEIQMGIDHQK